MLYAAAIAATAALCRWLTVPGAAAAFVVGAMVYECGGVPLGVALVLFFIGAVLCSRIRADRKARFGVHERKRNAGQVIANGGVAAACSCAARITGEPAWLIAAFAAVSAASADTWATEIGNAFGRRFFHITTMQPSEPGPNGVVSAEGLVGAFLGSAVPGSMLVFANQTAFVGPVVVIGFLGAIVDSLLGDTVEGRWKWLENDMVNFLATLFASLWALLYAELRM